MLEIFLFILITGLLANFIGASVHEGIFVGALVSQWYLPMTIAVQVHVVQNEGMFRRSCKLHRDRTSIDIPRSTYDACQVTSIHAINAANTEHLAHCPLTRSEHQLIASWFACRSQCHQRL